MSVYSAVDCGTLHLIPQDDIPTGDNTGSNFKDTSVSDTWESVDWSAYVPNGTKAVVVFCFIYTTSVEDTSLLNIRDDGDSTDKGRNTMSLYSAAELGRADLTIGTVMVIKATNGKFSYRRWSSTTPISTVEFVLRGYYI